MALLESGEMYLETILTLSKKGKCVRSIDVCEYMGYSKPSVSRAVSVLKSKGYLTVEKGGELVLSQTGLEVAEKIYERHNVLTKFLVSLGVKEEIASQDACKIEHDISEETFNAIKNKIK